MCNSLIAFIFMEGALQEMQMSKSTNLKPLHWNYLTLYGQRQLSTVIEFFDITFKNGLIYFARYKTSVFRSRTLLDVASHHWN